MQTGFKLFVSGRNSATLHRRINTVKGKLAFSFSVILLFFSFTTAVSAEGSGFITGRVFDRQTLEPLPSASIQYGRNRGTVTDGNGIYLIRVSPGNVNLTFKYVGFVTVTRSVQVTEGDTAYLDIGLEYEISEIDQIVISAGKVEQRVAELTVSMHIIRPEVLSSSHISDAAELINRTPGIEVLDGQASIRGGSGFSYGAGSRVLALVDGLPVVSADAGNIKWQFLPLENVSQIEVIKGASSVLYGSSALNGIVNFRTADAEAEPVTKFFIETGLFDRPGQKDWKWWDSPRTFSSASFSHTQRSGNTGFGVGLYLLNDNGYRKHNYQRLGRLNLKIKHDNSRIEGLAYGVNLNAGLNRKIDFLLWEDAWQGALKQQETTANELTGHLITLDPWVTFKNGDRYSHNLKTRFQASDNRFPEAGHNNSNAISFLAEYQFIFSFLSWINLNLGLIENYSRIVSEFYGGHTALNLAGYTQLDISPADRLKIVAGVRVEHNTLDGEHDALVPLFRAGLNYRLSDYTFLRVSFGQGYRYPSIAEKHAATTIGSVRIVPNPDIKAESGWSSEVGIKQGLLTGSVNGQVDLALFYTQNKDMIEYLFGIYPVPGTESFSYGFLATNVEQSRVYGCEVEVAFTGTTGSFQNSLNGGYTFMYPVEFDPYTGRDRDVYLKYRRKHAFKLSMNSTYGRYDLGFIFQLSSRMLNIDDIFLNEEMNILPGFNGYWNDSNRGYFVLDPHFGYKINDRFRISLAVKNILNTEYMGRPGDIMPHRNFSLRFSGNL